MERDPIVDNGYNRRKAEAIQSVIRGLVSQEVQLDGQTYQPSPMLISDTREGFDFNGDYHVDGTPGDRATS